MCRINGVKDFNRLPFFCCCLRWTSEVGTENVVQQSDLPSFIQGSIFVSDKPEMFQVLVVTEPFLHTGQHLNPLQDFCEPLILIVSFQLF